MGRTTRRWLVLAVMVTVATSMGLVSMAGAAPDHKTFETTIEPESATAGTTTTFDVTIVNTSTSAALGAVRITVPGGFTVTATAPEDVVVSNDGWTSSVSGNVIEITADANEFKLPPGGSITVSIPTVTPLQDGDDTYRFEVEARQANDFNGNRNDLNGSGPTVTITGVAEACERGSSCDVSFQESGTHAQVTTTCPVDAVDCTNLVLDLDENCLGEDCVGRAAFWVPPTIDSGSVELLLQIPKNQVSGGVGSVVFMIADKDDDIAVECGSHPEIGCSYKVSGSRNFVEISATIERVDPRGFVS